MILDDIVFKKYGGPRDGYQALIPTKSGVISVRYGSSVLFTSKEKPFEVWYPCDDAPRGCQNADDVYYYIKNGTVKEDDELAFFLKATVDEITSFMADIKQLYDFHATEEKRNELINRLKNHTPNQ